MKTRELIKLLLDYNPEANVFVVAHNEQHKFTLSFGSSEGVKKENCDTISFYVDSLCQNENNNK